MTRNLRGGELLRSITQVRKNEPIKTQFVDGYAQSIVQEMEAESYGTKDFLKTFIKSIVVNNEEIVINYTLPIAPNSKYEDKVRVLPIDTI